MQSLSAVQPACGHLRSSARKVSACAEPVDRRGVLLSLVAAAPVVAASAASAAPSEFASSASMDKLQRQGAYRLTEDEWKQKLTPGQFSILRNASTERPFANPLNSEKRNGVFKCAGCESPVFASETKFDSGTGWPSFYAAIPRAVEEVSDYSIIFLPRTEVRCSKCQGHLGHVFNDGPKPTGLRYCMNGLSMTFDPETV